MTDNQSPEIQPSMPLTQSTPSTPSTMKFPFSIYREIKVDIFTKKTNRKTSRFTNTSFFKKNYYYAHLYYSNMNKLSKYENLERFKECAQVETVEKVEQIENNSEIKTNCNVEFGELQPGEWIEDRNQYVIMCLLPATKNLVTVQFGNGPFDYKIGKEVEDAYHYFTKKGYHLVPLTR